MLLLVGPIAVLISWAFLILFYCKCMFSNLLVPQLPPLGAPATTSSLLLKCVCPHAKISNGGDMCRGCEEGPRGIRILPIQVRKPFKS